MRRALGGWFVIVDREIEIVEVFGEQALVEMRFSEIDDHGGER